MSLKDAVGFTGNRTFKDIVEALLMVCKEQEMVEWVY